MGKHNYTNYLCLVCGGGIISERLILTAAQCFITENGNRTGFSYSIVANKTNLRDEGGIEVSVDLIYLAGPEYFLHDIAVAQLIDALGVFNSPHLNKLIIPDSYESFWTSIGIVAGYGYNWIHTDYSPEHEKTIRLAGSTDKLLRYATVRVVNHFFCTQNHSNIVPEWKFCGKMRTEEYGQLWGTCEYDTGSPLVVGNKLAGIVSTTHYHCIDVILGGMYTRVSLYTDFINAIINGHPLNRTLIYHNRPHVI